MSMSDAKNERRLAKLNKHRGYVGDLGFVQTEAGVVRYKRSTFKLVPQRNCTVCPSCAQVTLPPRIWPRQVDYTGNLFPLGALRMKNWCNQQVITNHVLIIEEI